MKRILAFSLAMFLVCFCVGSPIFAANAVDDVLSISSNSTAEERTEIISALRDVEIDKAAFGLANVDFTQLTIGNKVNHYELTEDGFSFLFYSYPLLYNGDVVMLAYNIGGSRFQITTYESDTINLYNMNNVAVVYDSVGCYLYDGSDFRLVSYSGYDFDDRENLSQYLIMSSNVETTDMNNIQLSAEQSISVTSLSEYQNLGYQSPEYVSPYSHDYSDTYYSCTVDYLSQIDDTSCWAACIAMVVNYKHIDDYTVQDIIDEFPFVQEDGLGANMNQIASILRYDFNCGTYRSSDTLLTESQYVTNISTQYPVVAGFIVTGGNISAHAGVVDAVNLLSHTMRVCDPACGRVNVGIDDINEDQSSYGKYAYTSPSTGKWLYMGCQAARWYQ